MVINKQSLILMFKKATFNTPEFSNSFIKWIPFLCSSINKISKVTGLSDQDVLQHILTGIAEINQIYHIPLFRYKNKLYEKIKENGSLALLKTPRNNKSKSIEIWVKSNAIEPVKKGKLESTIYREINQQVVDIITSHFTSKNGYKRTVKENDEFVTKRSGKDKTTLVKKKVHSVEKIIEIIDNIEDQSDIKNNNPEDNIIFNNYVNNIKSKVSITVSRVLDVMINDPQASINSIAEYLKMNTSEVELAKCEIIRNIPFCFDKSISIKNNRVKPIYMTVS